MSTYRSELVTAAESHVYDLERKLFDIQSEIKRTTKLIEAYKSGSDRDVLDATNDFRLDKKNTNKLLNAEKRNLPKETDKGKGIPEYRSNKDVLQILRTSYEKRYKHLVIKARKDISVLDSHSSLSYYRLHRFRDPEESFDRTVLLNEIRDLSKLHSIDLNVYFNGILTFGHCIFILRGLKKAIANGKKVYSHSFTRDGGSISKEEIEVRRSLDRVYLFDEILKNESNTLTHDELNSLTTGELKKVLKSLE